MMNRIEVDFYDEIASELVRQIKANLSNSETYEVRTLIGGIKSGLLEMISGDYNTGDLLKDFSKQVHQLFLDITILIENKVNGKFEIAIFEIKKVSTLGLTELSQLIGYCLVSRAKFGILINVDKAVSRNFSIILDDDPHLTKISRKMDGKNLIHEFGVMVWNSETKSFEYTNSGAIKSIPHLVEKLEELVA